MNPLYEFVSELKDRIAKGEISGYTALDLFYQHVTEGGNQPIRPAEYGMRVPEGMMGATAAEIATLPLPDPVPEPASEEPADGQTAVEGAE